MRKCQKKPKKMLPSILVQRMQSVLKEDGLEMQTGFTPDRGTIDGIFTVMMALTKRKEHNLNKFCSFIDLQKAFDSVPRAALFKVLRRFGLPAHFVNIAIFLTRVCQDQAQDWRGGERYCEHHRSTSRLLRRPGSVFVYHASGYGNARLARRRRSTRVLYR